MGPRNRLCATARAAHKPWPLRLAAVLDEILATRRDLTPIFWRPIIWSTGTERGGYVFGLVDGRDRYSSERTFAEWQASLGLRLIDRDPGVLRAARTRRDGVRVLLVAILSDPPRKDLP